MSSWDGVFRCKELGIDDCVVWWDALAAVATSIGVVATLLLGIVTVCLAVGANTTSKAAMAASQRSVKNQEAATRAERKLILIRVQAEVAAVAVVCGEIGVRLGPVAFDEFARDAQAREVAHGLVKLLRLPVTDTLTSRLYNLDPKEAAYLARCLGVCETLREAWEGVENATDGDQLRELWDSLITYQKILSHDLLEIRRAAASAVASAGITTPALASALGVDPGAIASSASLDGLTDGTGV